MEIFVARQPIMNVNEELFAYELLYRNNENNRFPEINGDLATADVIINSFLNIGIDHLSAGKPCFINFTEKLLEHKLPSFFLPRDIIVEILENVEITKEVVAFCKELHEMDYKIALDDFVFQNENPYFLEVLQYIDIIKVDYLHTPISMRRQIESLKSTYNITLLAEKVETREQFNEAKENGYSYFQGYFFSKPVIMASYDVPTSFLSYYQIMNEFAAEETEISVISRLIEQDISLSYKLLKLINSPAFRPKHPIQSIKQAIILLGMREVQKWIYVLAIREQEGFNKQLSKEVLKLSLTRAKLCEILSVHFDKKARKESYFLTGMLSLLETILNVPMEIIIHKLSLAEPIHAALCGKQNDMKAVLDLAITVERADWELIENHSSALNISMSNLFKAYTEACRWTEEIINHFPPLRNH